MTTDSSPLAEKGELTMSNSVLGTGALAEVAGSITDFFEKLAGSEGATWLAAFKRFLRKENSWIASVLFQLITTASVSPTKRFVMKDHLQSANIGRKGDNFECVMLDKVEENIPAGELNIYRLEKDSFNPEIMAKLGPVKRVTFLAHFVEMIERQSQGQAGPFLTDGFANVAYIPGTDGNLWAVFAYWNNAIRGWVVEAISVGCQSQWGAGFQVLSQV